MGADRRPAWWPTAEQKRHADAGCGHPDVCKVEWPPAPCGRCGHRHGGLCVVETGPGEFALEADPGKLTASFPTFGTREEAERSASFLNARTPHLPPVRILWRNDSRPGGAWEVATR